MVLFEQVDFVYETSSQPIVAGLTAHFPYGWTGVAGANGTGKTTILRLATGELKPRKGQVTIARPALYCAQRTDTPPAKFGALLDATDGDAGAVRGRLGVEQDWLARWCTLSHGERKRAQIATALWLRPAVLAVDEPTNHIDLDARRMLAAALQTFDGVGLLVSHDREFLDTLCGQCLFMEPGVAVLRPGKFSEACEQVKIEEEARRRERKAAKAAHAKLKHEAATRREEATNANRLRSKRGLNLKDHDARAKKNLARITGKDGAAGRRLNQLEGRVAQAEEQVAHTRVKKVHRLGIWIPGTQSQRDCLFRLPAGTLPLGAARQLAYPDLIMYPTGRIALTGANGSGKSTLIQRIMTHLNVEEDRVTYLPQEIDLTATRAIMERLRRLPKDKLARAMTVVSRLNSRPERLLQTDEPSPGEIRKALLALGVAGEPHLIVMDEPTNHLDIPSIECLEQALGDCPCGLLLVSHDERFLQKLSRERWHIVGEAQGSRLETA